MKPMKLLSLGILLASPFLLAGCGTLNRKVVLYPIDKSDIFRVEKGSSVVVAEKDGYFLSDEYIQEVMDAKVK